MSNTISTPLGKGQQTGDWSRIVANSLRDRDPWETYEKLIETRGRFPEDLSLRGYIEIVRNLIVRNLLGKPDGMQAVPRLTPEFLSNFDRFNLNAQEGYLISLIDGRLDIARLLHLTPFDHFTTLFILSSLERQRAIHLPS